MPFVIIALAALFALAAVITHDKPLVCAFMAGTSFVTIASLVMAVA